MKADSGSDESFSITIESSRACVRSSTKYILLTYLGIAAECKIVLDSFVID